MIAILAATIIAYLPAIRAPFVLDDVQSIPGNPTIRALWPLSVPFAPPANTTVAGRPVVNLTLALNYRLNEWLGVDQRPESRDSNATVGYHAVNLLAHLACGLLLLGVVRRTARHMEGVDDADSMAVMVTALWLLHPIQSEAVDYLIQCTELLVSLCYLGTLYASIRAWNAALAYAQSGRSGDAADAASAAVRNAPGDAAVLILAGRAMLAAGRNEEAVQYLSEALRRSPGNREAAAYLARARGATRR